MKNNEYMTDHTSGALNERRNMAHQYNFFKNVGLLALGIMTLFTSHAQAEGKMEIKNPLIDEAGMSDPHMLVIDDVCYLFTGNDVGKGQEDWVMVDWRIYRSDDLKSWEHIGTIKPEENYMGKNNKSCWAGDIAERNGKYYFYFSNRSKNIGVMVADKIEGPYKDALGKPIVDKHDPSILQDDDGTPYIVWGSRRKGNYKIARLKDSMIELDEEPRSIMIDDKDSEGKFPKTDKPTIMKHNGIYYISCSGYYATSDNVYGPYKHRGVIGEALGLATTFAHGDFFVWKGGLYYVWCKYRNRDQDKIRDSFLAPVIWNEDGSLQVDASVFSEELLALPHR